MVKDKSAFVQWKLKGCIFQFKNPSVCHFYIKSSWLKEMARAHIVIVIVILFLQIL